MLDQITASWHSGLWLARYRFEPGLPHHKTLAAWKEPASDFDACEDPRYLWWCGESDALWLVEVLSICDSRLNLGKSDRSVTV